MPEPLLHSAQVDSRPQAARRKRRTEFMQPEIVLIKFCTFRTRLEAVEEIQLRVAARRREEQIAGLVGLGLPRLQFLHEFGRNRNLVVSEKSIVLSWAVLQWSCSPTDMAQAFRAALGQLLEYGHLLFTEPPNLVMFLDQQPDERRLQLATKLNIAIVSGGDEFVLLNPDCCRPSLRDLFTSKHG
jgi:hypothetical protein